jgi:NitT/TauT family transport system substrate-binding protein
MRRPGRLLAGAMVLLAAAGCAAGSTSPGGGGLEKTDLVVAEVPTAASAGLFIAQQRGFFTAAGLHVKIESVASGANVFQYMLHGSVDVDAGNYDSFVEAQAQGAAKFLVLADAYQLQPQVEEILPAPGSHITTVAQLAGKTIAINALRAIGQVMVDSVLADNGVPLTAVHLTAIPFPDMGAALKARRIDAAFVPEPYITEIGKSLGVSEIADCDQGATSNFPIAGYAVTQQWAAEYPKTAAAFTAAIERAQALAGSDRAAVEEALVAYVPNMTRQIADNITLGLYPGSISTIHLQQVADVMHQFGLLAKPFDMSTMTTGAGAGGHA